MIQSFFRWIKKLTIKDIVYLIIIILLSITLLKSCQQSSDNEKIYENNVIALNDTISLYKTKTGELIANKTAFESDIKELKNLNETLYNEIKELKSKNDILSGIHVNGSIENPTNDTVYIIKKDTINKGFNYKFNFNDKWRDLSGNILYQNDSLQLDFKKDIVRFDYTIAIDDKNKIYLKSNNPYVKYNEFSGFTIPKEKKKKFVFGPSINYGYDFYRNKPSLTLGVSATYKIFEF